MGCSQIAGVPLQGIYNASKAAAASLTKTLRLELEPFGIKVVDMKTGAVKSEFSTPT
jgi:1-acylglycerone phosphate reductase